jgi:hypothetical protein
MTTKDKIQYLLISHLLEQGHIELLLPDGLVLEVGVTKEGESGDLEKCDDYCWLIASQKDRVVSIDSYNAGLSFHEDLDKIVFEETLTNSEGYPTRAISVV